MPSFTDVISGASALASDTQQIIDALKGTSGKGIPLSPTAVNDGVNFALAVRNNDAGASKALIVYKNDGTVLLQVDKNGVIASPDGVAGAAPLLTTTGTQTLTNKTLTAPTMTSVTVTSGGITVTAGGVSIAAGGLTVTAGGLVVSASNITATAGALIAGASPTSVAGQVGFGNRVDAAGAGATATLQTVGGTGPTIAAQNAWLAISISGNMRWIPYWA